MNKKIKKIACVLGVAMTVCMCQFLFTPVTTTVALSSNSEYSKISVTNSSFENSSSETSLTTSFSGWNNGNGNAKKGVVFIDNSNSKFDNYCENQYYLKSTENPGQTGTDNRILMINSRTDEDLKEDSLTAATDYYYSNDITLEAYSYYQISVWANTIENAYASISLTGLKDTDMLEDSKTDFAGIQTLGGVGNWTKYSFFVATGLENQSVSLRLALGTKDDATDNMTPSKGVAFFDEVEVMKYSENYYYQLSPGYSYGTTNVIEYNTHPVDTSDLNLDFENGLENWERFGTYTNQDYTAGVQLVNKIEQGSDFSMDNTKALVLSADKNNAVYVGYKSDWKDLDDNNYGFDVKMNTAYEVSVMAKAIDLNGNASITLKETDYLEKNYKGKTEPKTSTITISTTDTNQLTNDYKTYKFYILGYELYDTQFNIELALGTEEANAYGSIAFDDIRIKQIPYDTFKDISESTSLINKITLSTITADPSVKNGNFNKAHSTTAELEYPLAPEDWTQTSATDNAVFGVVNTATWDNIEPTKRPFSTAPVNPDIELSDGIVIPGDDYSTNNFLLMYNPTSATQVVESPTFSASANSFYALTFNLRNYGQNTLTFKIIDDSNNVIFLDDNIKTSTSWTTYKIFFKTEYSSAETLKLEITLDNYDTNSKTYAFLDNFQFYTPSNFGNEQFANAVEQNLHTVDLSNLGFQQKGELNTTTNMYQATMFTGNLVEGIQLPGALDIATGGIIDEHNNFDVAFPATHTNDVKNMLRIQTLTKVDYNLTSKNKISLTSGNYYKFSVYIKTSSNKTNTGAYFNLVGLENAKFENIISNQDFTQYIIYVSANSDIDIQVQFGFHSETLTTESALFDTFSFETIDKTTFSKAQNSSTVMLVTDTQTTEAEEDTDKDSTASQASLSSILLALGTMILVVAFVVAIIGAFIRKAHKQKSKVKKQKEFEQKASLVRDASTVEAEKRRNDEIAELLKEKHQLEVYLKELEQDNKQRLAEQRRANGKTITHKAEKEFKTYAKNRQNIIRDMGRIDDRIKDAQSPEYLMRIIKIVQNEKVRAMENGIDTNKTNEQKPEQKPIDEKANAIKQVAKRIDNNDNDNNNVY